MPTKRFTDERIAFALMRQGLERRAASEAELARPARDRARSVKEDSQSEIAEA
ncbi:MAG: hypothetical protein AAF882_21640 [Pseudomonadota bacterium]